MWAGAALQSRSTARSFHARHGARPHLGQATVSRLCARCRGANGVTLMSDSLVIAGREFKSRLFIGTAGYPNRQVMLDALAASGTEMVTASIRRISLAGDDESLLNIIPKHIRFLPNTAGCQTARDAVLTA